MATVSVDVSKKETKAVGIVREILLCWAYGAPCDQNHLILLSFTHYTMFSFFFFYYFFFNSKIFLDLYNPIFCFAHLYLLINYYFFGNPYSFRVQNHIIHIDQLLSFIHFLSPFFFQYDSN